MGVMPIRTMRDLLVETMGEKAAEEAAVTLERDLGLNAPQYVARAHVDALARLLAHLRHKISDAYVNAYALPAAKGERIKQKALNGVLTEMKALWDRDPESVRREASAILHRRVTKAAHRQSRVINRRAVQKVERLGLRLTEAHKRVLKRASERAGVSMSSFILQSALRAAREEEG
jgi:uncharacterized protein (DUF2267 family)